MRNRLHLRGLHYTICILVLFCVQFKKVQAAPPRNTIATGATGLQFDGVDDMVNCGNSVSVTNLGQTGFTLEAWINLSNPSIVNSIIRKSGDFNLYVSGGKLHAEAWAGGVGNAAFLKFDGNTTISANVWTHIAATWNGTTGKLYVNGVSDPSGTSLFSVLVNDNLSLGRSLTFNQPMSGSLDEVRIWNRALCLQEIQNNRNCGLDPSGQTGLVALYHFDQGFINTNNSLVTTLLDQSGSNNNGSLQNFALTGTVSNWAAGTVTGTCTVYSPPGIAGVSGSQVCQSAGLRLPGSFYIDGSCNVIARVAASGASPVSGTINTCVTLDASVQRFNTQPYVQRHYDIVPSTNAATATGTVTLYFTQGEFNAYNLARGSLPALPVNASDATGIANIRFTQYHGTGTAPGNYTGSAVLIDPLDANIIWNSAAGRWEISFDVNGFSGFFLHTSSTNSVLPLQLQSFTGTWRAGINHLDWVTANEQNLQMFELQRSTDGLSYQTVATIQPSGSGSNRYGFNDDVAALHQSAFYYRLKIVDQDAAVQFGKIIKVSHSGIGELIIYPNPVRSQMTIATLDNSLLGTAIKMIDGNGKTVRRFIAKQNGQTVDVASVQPGIYFLQTVNGQVLKILKQ